MEQQEFLQSLQSLTDISANVHSCFKWSLVLFTKFLCLHELVLETSNKLPNELLL